MPLLNLALALSPRLSHLCVDKFVILAAYRLRHYCRWVYMGYWPSVTQVKMAGRWPSSLLRVYRLGQCQVHINTQIKNENKVNIQPAILTEQLGQ